MSPHRTAITLANGKPLPKAGMFAHFQAEAMARAIAADPRNTPRLYYPPGQTAGCAARQTTLARRRRM